MASKPEAESYKLLSCDTQTRRELRLIKKLELKQEIILRKKKEVISVRKSNRLNWNY